MPACRYCSACRRSGPNPRPRSNNAIVAEQVDLNKKNLRYIIKAAHRENDRKIENRRLEVVEQNKVDLTKLRHLVPFKGNDEFRLAAIKAFQTTLEVYSADYKKGNALASTRSESFENMRRFSMPWRPPTRGWQWSTTAWTRLSSALPKRTVSPMTPPASRPGLRPTSKR